MRSRGAAFLSAVGLLVAGGLLFGSQACGEAFETGPQGGGGAGAGTATTSTGTVTAGGGGSAGGSTSNGGTGAAAGSGGSSSGVGGSPSAEDCSNNQDDDGDTLVDCADDECVAQGFTCRALGTWQAPVILMDAGSEDQCPDGWQLDSEWQAGTTIEPSANACSCSQCDLSGVACSGQPGVLLYGQTSCGGTPTPGEGTALGSCFPTGVATGTLTVRARPITATGDCQVTTETGVCEVTGARLKCTRSWDGDGGCGEEAVCVPPAAPELPVCVSQAGDLPCPSELGSDAAMALYELHDTRHCSCGCEPFCSVTATLYCDTSCTSSTNVQVTGVQCGTVPSCGASRSAIETATPACAMTVAESGSCTDEGHRLTFCCWTG